MGITDRAIRFLIAALIVILYMTGQITGTAGTVALILAAVLLLTSYIQFCPLYLPFGISTKKEKLS